jgi:hypothetical protein
MRILHFVLPTGDNQDLTPEVEDVLDVVNETPGIST